MSKQQRGLGKGLGALLGGDADLSQIRKPVGYVNKEVVGTDNQPQQSTADILRIPMDMIPAYIRDTNDQGMLEMAIVENIQREDLDPIEVAMSYQRLIEECSLTQEQMAIRVGKKRASVTNFLRLLKLPAKIQHDLKVGLLSVGHAKVLLGVEDTNVQEYLCDLVIKEDLSVRQLEDKIRKMSKQDEPKEEEVQDLPEEYFKVLEIVGKYFENNISLKRTATGKGSMTIHFSSDEEVSKFLKALEDSKF